MIFVFVYNAKGILWEMLKGMIFFTGLCMISYFIFKFFPIYVNLAVSKFSSWGIHIPEQKKKIFSNFLRIYLSTHFFFVILMQFMPDPSRFERYYVMPNAFCTFWILACYKYVRVQYAQDWKPLRVLSKRSRIQNYCLWILIFGTLIFLLKGYLFQPIPYYVVFPLLSIVTTWVLIIWRNIIREDQIIT